MHVNLSLNRNLGDFVCRLLNSTHPEFDWETLQINSIITGL